MVHFANVGAHFANEVRTVRIKRTAAPRLHNAGILRLLDVVHDSASSPAYAALRRVWLLAGPNPPILRRGMRPVPACDMASGAGLHLPPQGVQMSTATPTLEVHPKTVSGKNGDSDVQTVSVAEASQLCDCSDDTIRRRLNANKLPGAFREGVGASAQWRIPVRALVEAGLCDPDVLEQLDERLNPNVARIANQLVDLRAELLTERIRRESAERMFADSTVEVQYLRRLLERVLAGSVDDARSARKLA